jgi:hypothetical protein
VRYAFEAEVWRWEARVEEWGFVTVPEEASAEIREYIGDLARGFGSVRVECRIAGPRGETVWRTSIFPGGDGAYVLPLKKAVRRAHDLPIGASATLELEILD